MLRLICALGNPTREYEGTRHNLGFKFMGILAERISLSFAFRKDFEALYCFRDGVHFLLPQTFMNMSGVSVSKVARFFKINSEEILVVVDELDLPSGVVRLKMGGGCSGHNGLKSIAQDLGSFDFWRLRLGISRPEDKKMVVRYVLSRPTEREEMEHLSAISLVLDNIDLMLEGRLDRLQNILNSR